MNKLNYWEIKRKIDLLRRLAETNADPSKHLPVIKSVFNGIHIPAITLKNEIIYRSRWNKGATLFLNTKDIGYPESAGVKRKGRLNDTNESVLYAAACELGTIIESRPDINKLFTISTIKPLEPEMLYFPLGITDKGYYAHRIKKSEELVIKYVNSEITKNIDALEEYNSTIALSWFFLRTNIYNSMSSGCIVYPSVESSKISNKRTYNFAISPGVFDRCFEITGAKVYCLTKENSHYQLNDLNVVTNIGDDGSLEWLYSSDEMLERISQGLTLDDTYCENIKGLISKNAEQGA